MKKKSAAIILIILALPLMLTAVFVTVTDPFFHYHAPIKGYPYVLKNERYQNDGIAKHFDYEILITGSSTSQVILPGYAQELWGKKTVRTSFAGGSLKETAGIIETAAKSNKDLKIVIRGLDLGRINSDKDEEDYDDLPTYMYDSNPFNDYKYLFNRDVLKYAGMSFIKLVKGEPADSFDDYENWNDIKVFGKEAVLSTFERLPMSDVVYELDDSDKATISANLEQNIIRLAREYPDVEFKIFIPPVSVCHWDAASRTGTLGLTVDTIEYAAKMLLKEDNISLYAFDTDTDITCNLDNYIDTIHYGEGVGNHILESMAHDENRITEDNLGDYINAIRNLYGSYDYESIYG